MIRSQSAGETDRPRTVDVTDDVTLRFIPEMGVYWGQFDPVAVSTSELVPIAVSKIRSADPLSLPPIQKSVDPDALDVMLAGSYTVSVTFEYGQYLVSVSGMGVIHIAPTGPT